MPVRLAAAVALAAALATLSCSCSRETSRPPDAEVVVALVDNVPVSLRELKGEILASRGYTPTLEEQPADREEVSRAIRRRVERTVVLREGERRGIAVTFAALEEEVARYRAGFPAGGLEKALLQVGVGEDEWRGRLRETLLYRKSAEAIASSLVSVTPRDVEEAFRRERGKADRPERVRVRQFLFESPAQAAGARDGLLRGESPAGGGVDLGFFARGELPPGLPLELFRMGVGEVTAPVPHEGSASLFRVEAKEAAGVRTPETEGARIRARLLSERKEEAFRRWLSDACGAATVKVWSGLLEKPVEGKR